MHAHSDFSNDDLDNFVVMLRCGLWQYLMTPIDVHIVPGHRLLSWAIYHVAPMNFSVAIVVVLACHIATLFMLWRTLQLLGTDAWGDLIVCGYAASALIVYGLAWWAHAAHRAPYVLLDACAIYHYLAWLKNGQRWRLLCVAVAFGGAFCFYEKAVLIPLHLLFMGYLADESWFRLNARRFLLPPILLLCCSAIYAVAYLSFHAGAVKATPIQALRADVEFSQTFLSNALGIASEGFHDVPQSGMSPALAGLVAALAALVGFSLYRDGASWKPLVAAMLLVMLDDLPIVLSNRGTLRPETMHQSRFGYEELHLFAMLAGIWLLRVGAAGAQAAVRWAAFAVILLYAGLNVTYLQGARSKFGLVSMLDQSHSYLHNLRSGLARIAVDAPVFENDRLPGYLAMFGITPDTRTMLPLFLPHARFDDSAVPRYRVEDDGHVVVISAPGSGSS
jgi:hypothetical protein